MTDPAFPATRMTTSPCATDHVIEHLEQRRLLAITLADGVLTVEGTGRSDTVWIHPKGSDPTRLRVKLNGAVTLFPIADVARRVRVKAGGGDDEVAVTWLRPCKIYGGDGDDTLSGGGARDRILGGPGDDYIFGSHGDDILAGGPGRDRISGERGHDGLFGHEGRDTLRGNHDNDTLDGGGALDRLIGGPDGDVFLATDALSEYDDFTDEEDTILA